MILKEWREKKGYSQVALASALENHAKEIDPENAKKLPQRTLGYWECGVLPRKFWLRIIESFTKNKVTSKDFVHANANE